LKRDAPHGGAEAGFTYIEVLVGLAITLAIGLTALGVLHTFSSALTSTYASLDGAAAIDERIADMRSQSATALAVFVPTNDVFGQPNAALGAPGHEVDFYSKNGTRTPIFWAYRYDKQLQTLQRYDYDAMHVVGVRIASTGAVDPRAAYPAITGVTAFSAQGLMASQLTKNTNPYAGAFSASSTAQITDLPVSMNNDGLNRPDDFAGNTVVQIRVQGKSFERDVHLAAGAFPSGFTYTGGPAYHAILWRHDNTVKIHFGTRSYAYIYADVDITYDNWKHYQVWCHQIPIYGEPKGLRPRDPHENYNPSDPANSANYALGVCIQGTGTPGSNGYYAAHLAPPTPDPYASPYPAAQAGSY